MKSYEALTAVLAAASLAQAQWFKGAPSCAQSCLSSFWSTATTSAWPAPTAFCSANAGSSVSSCVNSACSGTSTVFQSWSSLSSSVCSAYSSCSAAGSTGVYTLTASGFTGTWGPGSWTAGPGGPGGPGGGYGGPGGWGGWGTATRTWTGGVYTVTGCEWNGNPWAGGPGGWGPGGAGGSPWAPWGAGWTAATATTTVTRTVTSGSSTFVTTGPVTVAQYVSGDVTSFSTLGAEATNAPSPTGNAAAPGKDMSNVKIMGAVLGGVVAVAGML